jgi:flagellar basal-body rod protein FlgC
MSLLDAINIGSTGLLVHGKRMEVHAKNISNLDTPNYQRKIPVIIATDDVSFQGLLNRMKDNTFKTGQLQFNPGGVAFTGVLVDNTPGDLVYAPTHPDADKNGHIRRSNVNPLADIADANMSSRAYEASLAVIGVAKAMALKATEMGR